MRSVTTSQNQDMPTRTCQRICRLAVNSLQVDSAAVYEATAEGDWKRIGLFPEDVTRSLANDSIQALLGSDSICVIEDLGTEVGFAEHRWVTQPDNVSFVAAAKLMTDGDTVSPGYLVVTNDAPRQMEASDRQVMLDLAKTASDLLELEMTQKVARETRERLRDERCERQRLISELESSNSKLEQFAFLASHDLQEPLRMVTGFLGLLEDEYRELLDEDAREYIGFAVDGAQRMRQMINDLLTYSRMWSSTEPFVSVDTEDVLVAARTEILENYREMNVTIEYGAMPVVSGREQQLYRLFSNLLANAVQHSGADPRIEVWCEERKEHFLYAVVDHGVGVPEDQQQRIFDVFVSGSSDSSRSGSGIGLAICTAIVEEHGGRLWVESPPEEGAIFYFTLSKRTLS